MIEYMKWDSEFWNRIIGNLIFVGDWQGIASNYISDNKYDVIQAKIDINDRENIESLEKMGFTFIDLNITYERKIIKAESSHSEYKLANMDDIDKIDSFIENLFSKSRYNYINKDKVNDFYKLWLYKSINGTFDDVCLIDKTLNEILSFCTVKSLEERTARVGLIGKNVDNNKANGQKIFDDMISYLASKNIERVLISTQGTNIKANNFYIKNNCRIKSIEAWYYYHKKN